MPARLKDNWWLAAAGVFTLVPWLLFAIYDPLTASRHFSVDGARRTFYLVIDVFAPLFYLVDTPEGPMTVLSSHTSSQYQFWSWTIFSVGNFLYWCAVFGLLAWAIARIKQRIASGLGK